VAAFLETVTPSLISTLEPFQSTYSAFLNDQAGIVDDTIITNITESAPTYHVVTNAANYDRVKEYFETELANYGDKSNVAWEIVQNTGMIALQGPLATTILQSLKPMHTGQPFDLSTLTFGNARWLTFRDANETVTPAILVSRTGYTGEDGFELSIPHPDPAADNTTQRVTEYLLAATAAEAGGSSSDKPVRLAGLAARDILRIEAGLCLHGSDIDEATTPVQGSIAFIIPKARRTADAGWKGAATMYGPEAKKAGRKRVGLVMDQQVVARHGMRVLAAGGGDGGGAELGTVTSGGPSPTLGKPIAMASVASSVKVGDEVDVEIRKKLRKAKVVKMPFVPTKYYKGPEKS
jgi:aminomethyltransferase